MTIYVDKITAYDTTRMDSHTRSNGKFWSHMWSSTFNDAELHQMAERIGLRLSYFQPHHTLRHYDVTPNKRNLALSLGAVEYSLLQFFRETRAIRRQLPPNPVPDVLHTVPIPRLRVVRVRDAVPSGSRSDEPTLRIYRR